MLFCALVILIVSGQEDGRYRPIPLKIEDGKYRPQNDGKYVPEKTTRRTTTTSTTTTTTTTPKPTTTEKPKRIISGISLGGNNWKILRDEKTGDKNGYHYLFETENGILAEESGNIQNKGGENEGLKSVGFYQYIGDDGVLYRVDYVADENGFVAQVNIMSMDY